MLDAFAQGGFTAVAAGGFSHLDFEVRFQPNHPLGGETRQTADGREAMSEFVASFDDFHAEAEEVIDAGDDRVVVALRERGRPRGGSVELDQVFGILYTLRDGKLARMEWFDSPEQALAAARG